KIDKNKTNNNPQVYGLNAATIICGYVIFQASAVSTIVLYQTITAICQGNIKKIVFTAQSIKFALLSEDMPNFSPKGFTILGPINIKAGALAAIGIDINKVI